MNGQFLTQSFQVVGFFEKRQDLRRFSCESREFPDGEVSCSGLRGVTMRIPHQVSGELLGLV